MDNKIVGGLTGYGGDDRLESMYKRFLENHAAGDTTVDIVGFSRGAALAREFANMLHERGFRPPGEDGPKCNVSIRFVGLFDTVGSFGMPGNSVDSGVRMDLPPNVQNAAHALARDEKRALFPLRRLNSPAPGQNFEEKAFPGDHSDIGGGWGKDQNLLANAPLEYIWQKGVAAGAPFGELPERNLQRNVNFHDNRSAGHTTMVNALYNLNPIAVLLKGGFTSPTQERNLDGAGCGCQ